MAYLTRYPQHLNILKYQLISTPIRYHAIQFAIDDISIDPDTERLIKEAVTRITARRTTIIIAHRLSTIRHADRILVMHHGRIIEQGTHDQLMKIRGIYYKLNTLSEKPKVS